MVLMLAGHEGRSLWLVRFAKAPFRSYVVVHSRHDARALVGHGALKVLDDIRGQAHLFEKPGIVIDRNVLEDDLAAQRLGEFRRHLIVIHFYRAEQRIGLACMPGGALQVRSDDASLVLGTDGRMSPPAGGAAHNSFLAEERV